MEIGRAGQTDIEMLQAIFWLEIVVMYLKDIRISICYKICIHI